VMPTGLPGLTIAGLTAALMGHLSATYNRGHTGRAISISR
jgi:hypothetical protein